MSLMAGRHCLVGHRNIEFPLNGALQKLFFATFAQAVSLASVAQAMVLAGLADGEYNDACTN